MKRVNINFTACVMVMLCLSRAASAQEASGQVEMQPLPEKISAEFDQKLSEIRNQKEDIQNLEEQMVSFDDARTKVLVARRDRVWTSMFQNTVVLAQEVSAQQADGRDVSAYYELLVAELSTLPDEAYTAMQRLRDRVVFPTSELTPEEFVIADQRLFRQIRDLDAIFEALIAYVKVAEEFDLDASEERAFMEHELPNAAANRSIFLELALNDVTMLRTSVATLPANENLTDWLSAAQTRIQMTAKALQGVIVLMNALGLETRQYRQQLLTTTGEITTDVLDVGIVAGLVSQWGKASADLMAREGPRLIFRLLLVMFIFFAFFQFAKLVEKGVDRALGSARVSISHLLRRMIVSTARNLIIILGILIAISQLGISLGPLLAGLGVAGFIIGFALQDTLSNFASGVMILMYRPFDVGDLVEAGGVKGRVSHMSLVNTTFKTLDNQRLVVPNNLIWGSVITNVTAQRKRRIDLMFGISYRDDVEKAERVLREIVEANDDVLEDPQPVVKVHELGESSVNFVVRPWVKTSNYWDTYWDITKAVKLRFDEEGISIPFPQRDVHVIEQKG